MNVFLQVDLIWLRICLFRGLVPVLSYLATDHPAGKEESSTEKFGLKSLTGPSQKVNNYKSHPGAQSHLRQVSL